MFKLKDKRIMKLSNKLFKNKSFGKFDNLSFGTSFADVKFKIDDIIKKQGATFMQMQFNNAVSSNDMNKVNDVVLNFVGTNLIPEHSMLLERLCENIGNIYPLPYEIAVSNNNLSMVKRFEKHHEHNDNNALYYAIYGAGMRMKDDAKDMVEYLIKEKNFDLDCIRDFSHVTPLTAAISYRQYNVALLLLKYGASPTFPQRNSWTPGTILNQQNGITNFSKEESELRNEVIYKVSLLIEKEEIEVNKDYFR